MIPLVLGLQLPRKSKFKFALLDQSFPIIHVFVFVFFV